MTTEQLETADVAVRLKRKRINERVVKPLTVQLKEMFPGEKVVVGMGKEEAIKLRNWGDDMEKKIRRMVTTLGGKINRR